MPPARRPIQSKPDPRRPAEPPAPKCQANSLPVTPRHAQGPASVLNAPNCAKMAHLRSLFGYRGGTGGIRWGDGMVAVHLRGRSSVPFWHNPLYSPSLSSSNRYSKSPCPFRPCSGLYSISCRCACRAIPDPFRASIGTCVESQNRNPSFDQFLLMPYSRLVRGVAR